jgi:hypothetical protein
VLLMTLTAASVAAAALPPVKVFILAGQSNMQGQAVADLDGEHYNDGKGTLNSFLRDEKQAPRFKHLVGPDGKWTVRDDVWVRYQREDQPLLAGPLSVGFAVYGKHHFGPELQFGHVVGDHFENQVLLIKTAWGGKSLNVDFRPPSAGGEVGPYYKKMIAEVREALANLKQDFPAYEGQGYELAGFVWYQGWNDGCDPKNAVPEYESNLIHLIHDVRKEFDAPRLPIIVGELTGPWVDAPDSWNTLRQAQRAAAERKEFAGTAVFVPTHEFVRKPEDSPNPGHGHHEFGNAETYFLVGDALGKAAVKLIAAEKQDEKKDDVDNKSTEAKRHKKSLPTSHTDQQLEGWTIRVDDRLLTPEHAELGKRALRFLEAKLVEIKIAVPEDRVKKLQSVVIVLDLEHGDLGPMQYHPDAGWLKSNGYSDKLEKCVHLPRAKDLATRRNVREQPWVILHELAHAYHDQFLTFDDLRVIKAYDLFKQGGRGEKTLLYSGDRVKHYGLTNHKEFFAEMTEAYFGTNDFYPFTQAELKESEPETFEVLREIWEKPVAAE